MVQRIKYYEGGNIRTSEEKLYFSGSYPDSPQSEGEKTGDNL